MAKHRMDTGWVHGGFTMGKLDLPYHEIAPKWVQRSWVVCGVNETELGAGNPTRDGCQAGAVFRTVLSTKFGVHGYPMHTPHGVAHY
jgi:hypothetical protein